MAVFAEEKWCRGRGSNPHDPKGHRILSLAQTLVTRGHSMSLLTENFLSGHRYAHVSNFLAQISTRTMAESFPAKSTILDGHLRAKSSHAAPPK
jgi:hypothetical protein